MPPADTSTDIIAIHINGTVQGVGFRPFVYKLAVSMGLRGSVSNTGEGVRIIACGSSQELETFTRRLSTETPPMAVITEMKSFSAPPVELKQFVILESDQDLEASVHITPDIALCADCLREISDPSNRRHGYPFTNCTNCGPRFTIVEKVPYDRPHTSMRVFPMCDTCKKEYDDPLDRRFHAQPNACPSCGPQLSWHGKDGVQISAQDCITETARALSSGSVIAIKGLGGFHLAADATSATSVDLVRSRKHRPSKPLAIMVRDLSTAKKIAHISDRELEALTSPQHPIVLLKKKASDHLAVNLAPDLGILGIMLPYTPLHALLLNHPDCPGALIMTSGNRADEPICINNKEAIENLGGLADYFLLHNRNIVTRVDDSIVRIIGNKQRILRRARGFAPTPIPLAEKTSDILACGAQMKNTFCIVRKNEAYISQHIGELDNPENLDFFSESIDHLKTVLDFTPPRSACDMHPDYLSSRHAASLNIPVIEVQHHHAHTAAVMAEHGIAGPVLSVVLDGTGYSRDKTIYGGEIYLADRKSYTRMAHLSHLQLPGGEKAIAEPWRTAIALLTAAEKAPPAATDRAANTLHSISTEKRDFILEMLEKDLNCPRTSSCGRLFDAVSALLGLCLYSDYEGKPAMILEHQASLHACMESGSKEWDIDAYPVRLGRTKDRLVIDSTILTEHLLIDMMRKIPISAIAYRFHWWLIRSIADALSKLRETISVNQVTLAGGSMQNKILLEGLTQRLTDSEFTVYSGESIPANDGGIALGQAYIAGAP